MIISGAYLTAPRNNTEFLKDGLPYCKVCLQPRFVEVENGVFILCKCDCQMENIRLQDEEREKARRKELYLKRLSFSHLGDRYKDCWFNHATINENNRVAFDKCMNYVLHADRVLAENIGLYIYGNASTGKTYLTACLCNELLDKGYRCIYTSLNAMLEEIKHSFDTRNVEEPVAKQLRYCDFVFIDDFGKEFIGRGQDDTKAKWAEEQLFNILNERYNEKRPVIFTSNYSIDELGSKLRLDGAIIERVNEMSTRVIKLDTGDFRRANQKEKAKIAKELGI